MTELRERMIRAMQLRTTPVDGVDRTCPRGRRDERPSIIEDRVVRRTEYVIRSRLSSWLGASASI
jgi:hypothetical protein